MSTETFAPASAPSLPPAARPRRFPWGALVGVALSLLCLPFLLTSSEGQRGLLAFSVAGTLFFILKRDPGAGVVASFAYLALVGGLRRWLLPVFDWSGTDPLLVAAPGAAIAFLLFTRRPTLSTPLKRLLSVLMALMALEVVNPLQGGLVVGLTGMLFYFGPLLWYFVARQIGTPDTLRRLFRGVMIVSVAAAAYGLYQTYFGFNLGERLWIKTVSSAYQALNVSSTVVRAFSFATSAQEYAQLVVLGIVAFWVAFLRGRRAALIPILLLAVALFLESSRGQVFAALLTCVVLWVVQGRSRAEWGPRLIVAGAIAVIGLPLILHQVQGGSFSDKTQDLVAHQVKGLLNPLDRQQSTASDHADMAVNGIVAGFRNPVGRGLGATTLSGQKFGGESDSAEVDVSNMFVSLGFIGGLLYTVVILIVLAASFAAWQKTRSLASLIILGVLLCLLGSWLTGGAYSTSMLAWFCIGALDRLGAQSGLALPRAARPAVKAGQPA